jgi:uncharacterized protein YrrD
MLLKLDSLRNLTLYATDEELGGVKDVYFEDRDWAVRYLVVTTGGWLSGREVLLSPHIARVHEDRVTVALTRDQVRSSPPPESDQPISRQYETALAAHYGWTPYWGTGTIAGGPDPSAAYIPSSPVGMPQGPVDLPDERPGESHLRSAKDVCDYRLWSGETDIGKLSDVILDINSWTIPAFETRVGNWLSGRSAIIPVNHIDRIEWLRAAVFVDLSQQVLEARAEADDSDRPLDHRLSEARRHLGRPS